jgi:hypothetical protein
MGQKLKKRFEVELVDQPDFVICFNLNLHAYRLQNCVCIQAGLGR